MRNACLSAELMPLCCCLSAISGNYVRMLPVKFLSVWHICRFRVTNEAGGCWCKLAVDVLGSRTLFFPLCVHVV